MLKLRATNSKQGVLEMSKILDKVLSVGSWFSSGIATVKDFREKYKTLCAIHYGDTLFDQLGRKIDQKFEKLSEHIIYAPNLQAVEDTTKTTQQVYRDYKQIHDTLEPVQRALNQDILSSAMILTPDKMQQALITNPFEILADARPIDCFDGSRMPPEGVPVIFERDGVKFMGWQLKGTLPFLFNCRYDELWIPPAPSIISNPISQTILNWQSIPAKIQYNNLLTPVSQPILKPQATDLIVSPNGNYPTINSALKAAKDGDKIIVKTGLYKESIVLNKMVELIAEGSPIIESSNHCIDMKTNYAVVKGFTIQCKAENKGDGNNSDSAIYVSQGQLILEYCDVTSSSDCVEIRNKNTLVTIKSCKIRDSERDGVWVYKQGYAQIEDCEIFGNIQQGIEIETTGNAIIRRCKIYNGKQFGVWVYENGTAQIEDCEIFGNAHSGIRIKTGGNPTIRRCKIINNGYEAIWVSDNGKATVEDCDLRGNEKGAWDIDNTSQVQEYNNNSEHELLLLGKQALKWYVGVLKGIGS